MATGKTAIDANNIERLYKEWRAAQPLNETLKHRMDQQFMIDFCKRSY